jgi:unsaturated chondroitin disaccharide hydrolase
MPGAISSLAGVKRALLAIACAACLGASAAPAGAAPLPNVVADDLAPRSGTKDVRRIAFADGEGVRLSGRGSVMRRLPHTPWSLSLDVRPAPESEVVIESGASKLVLTVDENGVTSVRAPGLPATALPPESFAGRGWRHLEIAGGGDPLLAIDGEEFENDLEVGESVRIRVTAGSAQATALIGTRREDRRAALLHRLAELHARTPLGRFPVGIGTSDSLLRFTRDWTDGFWPGSLWLAADLTGPAAPFADWARVSTDRHRGREGDAIHDQGFRYLTSSAAAHDRLCRTARQRSSGACKRLRESAVKAANTLLALAADNEAVGTIPTVSREGVCRRCASPDESETIIDSLMNLGLLAWTYRERRDPRYREVALRHARRVEELLVRPDGGTAQSVIASRIDGHVVSVGTRQGYSDTSTWARGQGWALYGLADLGARLRDRASLATAERVAEYVDDRLPGSGIPLYDYDAPAPAPIDTSAGVITAAGALRLAAACESLARACEESPARWRSLGLKMLRGSLARVRRLPPIGMLGEQVYSLGGGATWDDEGEYAFGLHYAFDAIRRERAG